MYSLRQMTESDLPTILGWRNHPDVRKNMYTQHVISWDEHAAWFHRMKDDPSKRYFVCVNGSEPVGVVGFYGIRDDHKTAEWAFYSGDVSARGVGSQMEFLALEYAFLELGLEKLSCEVLGYNESVIAFHRKHGFRVEGVRRRQYFLNGRYEDVHLLALFRKDWLGGLRQQCQKRLLGERETARLRVGAKYVKSVLLTPDIVDGYSHVTGDSNPVHLSDEAARQAGFPSRIGQGMLLGGLISGVLGLSFPGPGTIYLAQDLVFKKPVFVGETVTVTVRILSAVGRFLTLSTSITAADGEIRCSGEAFVRAPEEVD